MHGNKLQHAKLIVPVTDFQHAVATIANLADLREQLRVNDLDVEIQVVGSLPIAGQGPLGEILTKLTGMETSLQELKVTEQEVTDLLTKIDTTTNHTADNVKTIADVDQKISDEIDAFLKAAPAGTTLTDAQVAQLQAIADRAQATSDAGDAQVTVLQAIAAKGAATTPPPPPPVNVP